MRSETIPAVTARCRARLAELDLPRPFDARTFCESVGARRGRPLLLLGMRLPAEGPRGLWISTGRTDYLVYEEATSALHQEHIILHELSHLLCEHTGHAELGAGHLERLFPELDPELVRRMLARACYGTEEEQEAEILASLILQQAGRERRRTPPADPAAGETLRRLEAGL